MKKVSAVLVVVLSLCLAVSMAFAAETKKGVVKSVDEKAGAIVLTVGGKDETIKAGTGVDLKAVKAGSKATVTVDGGVATKVEADKPKASVGC